MKPFWIPAVVCLSISLSMTACKEPEKGSEQHILSVAGAIDDSRLISADDHPGDWLSYGRNYAEDRYSTLDQINKEKIEQLGLAWSVNLGMKRGIESTPIVVDGIMYVTGPWSMVFAIDARKGNIIWKYDPQVPKETGRLACCDVVNRGVALYKGLVYVGTLDGRLIALDASKGTPEWEVTTTDPDLAYTVTGAPRIVEGKVIIGNGGAEYGVRGYITAYDALTGKEEWRFFTVPGDPSQPFESPAMEVAAKTWTGEWWKYGGGGTAWDAMAYDPDLKLLYIGVGNGAPWNRLNRSPGGGDNLYLSSIVAVNPENGEMIWYYQTTPGDTWDYTATQHLILADLEIEGIERKVIMQAPKNGFFYVLDRTNGEFISAEPYVYVNWATEIDPQTGRPVETDFSRYEAQDAEIYPSIYGGHNWHPMSYNPQTGLVYIPARELKGVAGHDPDWKFRKNAWNSGRKRNRDKGLRTDTLAPPTQGKLIAWDPVAQKEVWKVEYEAHWNGGVLSTAAGMVFQGAADGKFRAYDAENGNQLWEADLGTGMIAPPVTYLIDGVQYISIAVGWGGAGALQVQYTKNLYPGTIYTFALNRDAPFPDYPSTAEKELAGFEFNPDEEGLESGAQLYNQYCRQCHGQVARGTGGALPDLGYINESIYQSFENILLNGILLPNGMPGFKGILNGEQVEMVKNYILSEAHSKLEQPDEE